MRRGGNAMPLRHRSGRDRHFHSWMRVPIVKALTGAAGGRVEAKRTSPWWLLLLRHGINAVVERLSQTYQAAVKRSLSGRTPSRAALAHGLPKEAIRSILNGHEPKLARADDVCRALGFTFLLGGPLEEESADGDGRPSEAQSRIDQELVRDMRLAELVSRLADRWESIPVRERAGLGMAIASILDLAGARGGASLERVVEYLGWRMLEEGVEPDSDPEGAT